MEVRADAAKRRVCIDRFRCGFGEVGHNEAVMISARRFDRHAAQQRVIQIGSLEPRNVRRDSKHVLEHWQRAASQRGGQNSISDSERTLPSDHAPVVGRRIKPIDWSDQPKRQRQQPNREPDIQTSTDQFAAPPHLQR